MLHEPRVQERFPIRNPSLPMNAVGAVIRLTFLEAVRVRLFWVVAFAMAAALGLERFLGHVALIEADAIEASVAAAVLRLAAAFIVMVFVITSMVREAADKVTELLLSQPVSRGAYYGSKLAGYVLVAVVVGICFAVPLSFALPGVGLASWAVSLIMELCIVAAASLFCVLSVTQVAPALAAAAGFYLLARSMATLELMAQAAGSPSSPTLADRTLNGLVELIALLLPSLDRMASGAWFTQPPALAQLGALALQTAVYVALLAAASLFDLYRKNL
jgi:ABC-type transport system involved in multi-copper enzyme maturation permease subunit